MNYNYYFNTYYSIILDSYNTLKPYNIQKVEIKN